MRIFSFIAAALLATAISARADVVQTFDLSGTFYNNTDISGTVTIDTTSGVVKSTDLSYLGREFTLSSVSSGNGTYQFDALTSSGFPPQLDILIATGDLTGYSGGSLCSGQNACSGLLSVYITNNQHLYLESGSLTAATPEPSSLMLLGTGLLGCAGMLKRRFFS